MRINEVLTPQVYSTSEEHRIGIWVDGKPLYRKVISFSVTAGMTENSFNIPNYDDIWINVGKSFVKSSTRSMPLTRADYRSLSYQVGCVLAIDTNKIFISIGGDVFSGLATAYVTLEYTKTTD